MPCPLSGPRGGTHSWGGVCTRGGVGFFFELPLAERVAALAAASREAGHPDEAGILQYLGSGAVLAAVPGTDEDLLSDLPRVIGPMHLRTDGVWARPETLAYYVRAYHVALPDEFIEHMRASGWSCPQVPGDGRLRLEGYVNMG